ncbi:hypothetical protein JSE7799_00347 [Jannaschia seosinensis]|uniref:Phosphodiester glycosidase domain-containing protein n=1 Tax=Jannaschia seosinensis TaxID=313367 RepID=A0A0M7B746_9RHOB|nr:phosphodiester glycosidase family protein [Jannaschia seosinensis]CUH16221.1 hypothetical protein JSE7799_00347 [Jannaschia seosinensis]
MIRLAALLWLALAGTAAAACEAVTHRGQPFTICTADPARHDIATRLSGADGAPLGSFDALERETEAPILFATNGGMYHADRAPVGLYVEDGETRRGIVTRAGPGNFGMVPNGVFCVMEERAAVIESRAFAADPRDCVSATQSGPMLVIDGALHPRFLPDSDSAKFRNGVGVGPDGMVHFAISDAPVTFHEMGTLFRDVLATPNALFLDGSISRLHAPALGRSDQGRAMGPILVVTERN